MKRISKLIAIISFVLVFLFTVEAPVSALQNITDDEQTNLDKVIECYNDNIEETSSIVSEIEEERSEYTKTFNLEDGNKLLVGYGAPVHYKDQDDNWVEYDNTLSEDTTTIDDPQDDRSKEITTYTNKGSDMDVSFSKVSSENNMLFVGEDDDAITWGYKDINDVSGKLVKDDTEYQGNQKFTVLKDQTSTVKYESIYKDVDLNCSTSSTGVKEDIILKNADAQNEFDITYNINDLTAEQTSDNCITLYKEDEEKYRITAPYMTDANGEISDKITLKIIDQKDGKLNVRLTADSSFIRSSGRAFPVIIDPEVTVDLRRTGTANFYTCQNGFPLSYPPYILLEQNFTYIIFNSLPEIKRNERIISAKLHLCSDNADSVFADDTEEAIIINAHEFNGISNNTITYNDTVLDYDSLTYEDHEEMEFDITRSVNNWLNNDPDDTDALILEAFDTINNRSLNIKGYITSNGINPILTYVYKDFKGTENSLSYHTVNAGHNAKASVSDYLGNLVLNQTLFEGNGARLPFSASVTYNSLGVVAEEETTSLCGNGWHFSFDKRIKEASTDLASQGYDYIYVAADGANHYLKREDDSNVWYDEDSLGLSLSVEDDYIIVENGSATQTYELPTDGGRLLSEKDDHDNTISYSYSNGTLDQVEDPSGRTITFNYTTSSENDPVVSSIQTYDNKTISFNYDANDNLSYIQFSDGSISRFTYDDSLLVSAKEERTNPSLSGQSVAFDYDGSDRVITITEKGTDNTIGNYLDITYGNDNTTTFTDSQERESTYTFDHTGSLVSVLNSNGYLESNSSEGGGLSIGGGTESFTKNYISDPVEPSTNYYYKIDGIKDNTTSNGGEFTINNAAPSEENGKTQFMGNSSIMLHNPVLSNDAAFYTCAAHNFSGNAFRNKTVTLSAYVKTKNIQQIYSGGAVGASLRINCVDSSGNSVAVADSIGFVGTEEWQRLSVSCDVPNNTNKIVIYCMNRYASGTAWFDCLQFEIGNSAGDFNALRYSDFYGNNNVWKNTENGSVTPQGGCVTIDGISGTYDNSALGGESEDPEPESEIETYYVETTETEPYGSVSTYDDYGNLINTTQGMVTRSVKKTYEATESPELAGTGSSPEEQTEEEQADLGNKYIYQDVNVNRAGVIFNISGEAQANSVPLTNEKRTFGIALNIYYADNPNQPEMHYQEFNAYTSHTQAANMTVTPNNPEKVIDHVAFLFVYSYNENTITISNSMLNIALTSYSTYEPTATNDEESGSETADNYIDYEVTSESVDKTQPFMESSKTYDSSGNYVVSEIDESGKEITYTYDTGGNTTSVTDSDYNTYEYSYDSSDRIAEISYDDSASNTYSYNNAAGNVTSIEHNDFAYTFNYNVFDKLISSKIGNVTISSNTYSANNGNLLRTDYANGDYITYEYDDYDNIIEIAGENGTIASFVYNKKGMISKCVDELSDTTTYYYYDFAGNVTGEYRQSEDGSLSYHVGYDSNGNMIQNTAVNGQTKTITSGVDSDGNSFTSYDGITVNSTSDDFGRTTKVKTSKSGMSDSFYTEYQYANGSAAHSTSNLISGITQKLGENDLVSYSYDYNDNENVEYFKENGERVASYAYGDMNQLSCYADRSTGVYKYFYYDDAGNLTGVTDYRLLISYGWLPGSEIESHTYTYGDNNWKDKLTKYDNQTITYDANGNPLQYRDGMSFTWINGRILDTVTVDNDTIEMQYDYNGMRTQKGNTQYYYDSENRLIGMTKGSHTLLFYYDENGNPTAFTDNGTIYFYIRNLQGDIVKIVNSSGAVVVNYIYDALGKKLSVKDASDNEITDLNSLALLNPLRYRGYVYDDETGLYYLQSRYYDPTIGRFINADNLFDTASGTPLSTNMFAYCENNSILRIDDIGNWYYDLEDYYYGRVYSYYRIYRRSHSYYAWRDYNYYNLEYHRMANSYFYNKYYYDYRSFSGNYIYGQSDYRLNNGNIRIGNFNSTVKNVGCGAIAIYNLLVRRGVHPTLPNVILELEMNDGLRGNGLLGFRYNVLIKMLRAKLFKFKEYSNVESFKRDYKQYTAFLVYQRNQGSLSEHFFVVLRNGNKLFSLNYYNDQKTMIPFYFNYINNVKIYNIVGVY